MDMQRVLRTLTVADVVGLVAIGALVAGTAFVAANGINRSADAWRGPAMIDLAD